MDYFYITKTLTPKQRGSSKMLSFYSFSPLCNDYIQLSEIIYSRFSDPGKNCRCGQIMRGSCHLFSLQDARWLPSRMFVGRKPHQRAIARADGLKQSSSVTVIGNYWGKLQSDFSGASCELKNIFCGLVKHLITLCSTQG